MTEQPQPEGAKLTHAEMPDSGLITHQLLDNLYLQVNNGDLRIQVNQADVTNPPTDAELDATFGTPAAVGAGFIRLLDDAGAGANFYLVASDGANWWTFTAAKAV